MDGDVTMTTVRQQYWSQWFCSAALYSVVRATGYRHFVGSMAYALGQRFSHRHRYLGA